MMENGKIIGLKGEMLVDTGNGHKRTHDPERHNNMRARLNNTFIEMQRGWAADMFADPTGATVPNVQAIRQHWGEKWQAQAVAVLNSNEPIEVNPLRLFEWIDRELEAKRRKEQLALPLHQLEDLEPHGFKLLGLHKGAQLWVSTECAVMLVPGGMTGVYLRRQGHDSSTFVSVHAMTLVNSVGADIALPDYRLGELLTYLESQRRERPAHPDEEDLSAAREDLSPAQP